MSRFRRNRSLQTLLLFVFAFAALGAGDSRFDKDSHEMVCICGCTQMLGECNHVGCPDSDRMRTELAGRIGKGESDDTIFHAFAQEYGPVVLAAPMFTPFNHLAWIMPPLVFFLGIASTLLLVRKWKLKAVPRPVPAGAPVYSELRDRIRRETEL